jgi:hypothetical protein
MIRSIVLAGLALAGLFGALRVQAAETATSAGQSPMCQEISYTEHARKIQGPPGKHADVVKVTKRTRLVCNDNTRAKKPRRAAALMHHHKSA